MADDAELSLFWHMSEYDEHPTPPPPGCQICGKDADVENPNPNLAAINGCDHQFCYRCIYKHWFGEELLKEQEEQDRGVDKSDLWFKDVLIQYENEFPANNRCPVCQAFFSRITGPVEFNLRSVIHLEKVQLWHHWYHEKEKEMKKLTKDELETYEKSLTAPMRQEIRDRAEIKFQWSCQYKFPVREWDRHEEEKLVTYNYIPTLQAHFYRYYRKYIEKEYHRKVGSTFPANIRVVGDKVLESLECELSEEKLRECHEKAFVCLLDDDWEEYCYDHLKLPQKQKFLNVYLPCLKKQMRNLYIDFMCELYRPTKERRVLLANGSRKDLWIDGQVVAAEAVEALAPALLNKYEWSPGFYCAVTQDRLDFRSSGEFERFVQLCYSKLHGCGGGWEITSKEAVSYRLGKFFSLSIKGKVMGHCIEHRLVYPQTKHKVTSPDCDSDKKELEYGKKRKLAVPRNSK